MSDTWVILQWIETHRHPCASDPDPDPPLIQPQLQLQSQLSNHTSTLKPLIL